MPLVGNPADPNAADCGPDAVQSVLSDFSADYCVRASDIDVSGNISFLASYVGGLQHFGSDVLDQPRGTTAISVHVDLGPGCSIQPESQTVCQGVSATFTATGSGQAPPLSFTWTGPNSFTASGATITATDAGNYTVNTTATTTAGTPARRVECLSTTCPLNRDTDFPLCARAERVRMIRFS